MPKRKRNKKKGPSKAKARKILKDGSVKGKKLTPAQKRFMGARAGGAPMKSRSKKGKSKRNRKSMTGSY